MISRLNKILILKKCFSTFAPTKKMIVELHLANGEHNCIACEKNGHCELQDMAYHCGIERPIFMLIMNTCL
jgi:predicted molibdopterin-dependent oxidoreductase YjgC